MDESVSADVLEKRVRDEIRQRLVMEAGLSRDDREQLENEIADDILAHGPLERLLKDESVTEIMVNGPYDVWIERAGRLYETNVRFIDDSHLRRIINKIVAQAGRRIDESSPLVDRTAAGRQPCQRNHPTAVAQRPLVTIRKFSTKRLDMKDMIRIGTLTPESAEFLESCLHAELNILVSGGTGSGGPRC